MEAFFVGLWQWAASGILVVLVWGVKELISFKRHQLEETAKFELELKKLAHSVRLELDKLEHEVRFKKVYDQVSTNVIDLFAKLATLKRDLRKFTPDPTLSWEGDPEKETLYAPVAKSYDEAFNTLHEKRLLIPIPIFHEVAAFLKGVRAIIGRITSGMSAEKHGMQDRGKGKTFWEKTTEDFQAMEPQYEKIHEAMQTFLGLPPHKA